ncbi:MAG: NUDIX hydrolase [Lachnospiraceae bacterium]|nr:NUDIX hydrolase [Lachnospiraceae bacterium]
MEFLGMQKVKDGKYLKNYELTYRNKAGKEKRYEIVSRKELKTPEDIGKRVSGVSIVVTMNGKLMLLREFRMSINKTIFNLCAGMLEEGETIEECIARELYEETGLKLKRVREILPPSYSAVGISDTKTYIAFVEAEGSIEDHTSQNEEITASFYSKEEVKELLQTEEFSSRSQIIAYFFANSVLEQDMEGFQSVSD